jgi:rod shape determining protein RodA
MAVGVSIRSKSMFGSLIAIGIAAMLFVHLWINIAMVMGLIPVVGVPLPMLSYGGSIMISIMLGFGLLLNAWVNRDVNLTRNSWGGF